MILPIKSKITIITCDPSCEKQKKKTGTKKARADTIRSFQSGSLAR